MTSFTQTCKNVQLRNYYWEAGRFGIHDYPSHEITYKYNTF